MFENEVNENSGADGPTGDGDAEPDNSVTSIFDVFEPPPEIDPNKFGPVPIIGDSDVGAGEAEQAIDLSDTEVAAISAVDFIDLDDFDLGDIKIASSQPVSVGEGASPGPVTALPHWTEPATGQAPLIVGGESDTWQDLSGPRWKGEGPDWAEDDLADVFGMEPVAVGSEDEGLDPEDFLDDDDIAIGDVVDDDDADVVAPAAAPARSPGVDRSRPHLEPPTGERNIPVAVGAGIVMAGIALAAFRLSGNLWALGLITVVAVVAAVELFDAMRRAGLHPATLLGLTAALSFPLAVYWRTEAAVPLMLGLTVVFGALWYIVGADTHRPALNLGLTFLGIAWIGGLASFASLILLLPDGKSILVAAVIITVASDTFALAGGKAFGSRPFHSASPNKTWEGTIVGFVAAVAAGAVVAIFDISPFSIDFTHALYLGVVGGLLAPIGDLTESMVKRDLGIKDMGRLLPGHGGVLDRFDGLLFVLPGAYYLALVLGLT
ncbi:MAG: phosphatidate cytidylyltransferase [Acidimicrobiales bacterium]|jgi:phosphatidate cytidylyltransferase